MNNIIDGFQNLYLLNLINFIQREIDSPETFHEHHLYGQFKNLKIWTKTFRFDKHYQNINIIALVCVFV